ncbi:hypothetical protein KJA16_01260 [Patescibacteria group bacterium]|nr:hypothetical protein [Patescibacteria group bacterium]
MKAFGLEREKWWSNLREDMGMVVTAASEDEALEKVAGKFNGKVEANSNQGKFVSLPQKHPDSKDYQPYIYLAEKGLIA